MTDKKIINDYTNGRLPFSELYRMATQDDKCPEHLSEKVFNMAIRKTSRRNKRIWLEAALLLIAFAVLFIVFYAPRNTTELDCPREPIKQILR